MADSGEQDASRERAEVAYETWRELFELVPEAVYVQDEAGRFLDVNAALIEMYGYTKHELLGQTASFLAAPGMVDLDASAEHLRLAFAGEPQSFVWWGRRKQGETFPKEVQLQRARFFGQDVVVAVARDISDRFARQQALAESEARYRATFEAASDGLLIVDAEGEVRSANPRAAELLERGRHALRGSALSELLPAALEADEHSWDELWLDGHSGAELRPRTPEAAAGMLARALTDAVSQGTGSRGTWLTGWCLRTRSGELRWLDLGFTRFNEGEQVRVLVSLRDVSERKRAHDTLRAMEERQQLADRLRALGELAAGVAHNFNNSLTSILAHATMLARRGDLPEPVREDLRVIERVARGAAVTVRRIQTFARARDREGFESLDVQDVVANALALTRPRWEPPEGVGRWQVEWQRDDEPLAVEGNAYELCEVVVNLILNAVDAMPEGGALHVRSGHEGDRAFIELRDTGIGIDEATQRKLFDPFFSTKGRHGHGLGLSVSHGIIRRHGGEITLVSRPREGATFTVWLPRELHLRESVDAPIRAVAPATVLLVDDEPTVRGAVEQMLVELGHRVITASGGREALRVLDERRDIDLLLSDLAMPGLDGAGLLREAKRRWPQLRMMLMTGLAADADNRLLELADDLLGKPIELSALQRSLAKILPAAVPAG